jgi:hypothetical protein
MEPRRQMGLTATIAVVIGESIALGIFLTPAAMAKSLGSPALLAAVWCGMAVMALAGALCYSELAVRYPQAGGEYVYLREGYGSWTAFLYGWMSAAVLDPGLAAALAIGAVPYVQAIVPISSRTASFLPAAVLLILAGVNYAGTKLSSRVMATANLLKIAVLLALVAWAWVSGHASTATLLPLTERRPGSDSLILAIAGASVNAFFSFGGWWEAGKLAGEVRNPRRTLPLAFTCGVLLVTAVYLLVSFEHGLCSAVRRGALRVGGRQGVVGMRPVVGGGRTDGADHGRASCLLRNGERRQFLCGFRPPASALWNSGQCHTAADRHGAAHPVLRRVRPHSRLHYFFRGVFSCAIGGFPLPIEGAGSALVVSGCSDYLSAGERGHRRLDSDAQPIAGTHWGGSSARRRHAGPQITDLQSCNRNCSGNFTSSIFTS